MTFDPTKPVQTRDERKVRILCVDRIPPQQEKPSSIVALVEHGNGETLYTYFMDGRLSQDMTCELDLVNKPKKQYINIWIDSGTEILAVSPRPYTHKKDAMYISDTNGLVYIARGLEVKI